MTERPFDGGLYAFALPDGSYGVLYPGSRIETNERAIVLPAEDVLFLVGTRFNGRLYMAGQGHLTGRAWLWNGALWLDCGPTFGVSPCAFGEGALYVEDSATTYKMITLETGQTMTVSVALGSQGIRYVENAHPVSGDATYRDGELFEWTRRGDVVCGQGHEGGALINGRVLESGDCRFIRFERAGDQLAIAIVKTSERRAVLHWLGVADIASLPLPSTPPVDPPPPPPPPPEHPMVPESEKQRAQAMLIAVRAERNFGAGQEPLPYVRAVAERLGYPWGLNGKRGDPNNPSGDILAYDFPGAQPQLFDVLGDSGGANTPQFSALDYPQPAGAVFIRVGDAPPPPPPLPPAGDDVAKLRNELHAAVADLLGKHDAQQAQIDVTASKLAMAEMDIESLKHAPPPVVLPKLRVRGNTGRTFGHGHSIDLPVIIEP